MGGYITTVLAKLEMEGTAGHRVRMPTHKPTEGSAPISIAQASPFRSAAGGRWAGWCPPADQTSNMPTAAHRSTCLLQGAGCRVQGAAVQAMEYCASTMAACLHQPYGVDGKWRLSTGGDHADAEQATLTVGAHAAERQGAGGLGEQSSCSDCRPEGDTAWNAATLGVPLWCCGVLLWCYGAV